MAVVLKTHIALFTSILMLFSVYNSQTFAEGTWIERSNSTYVRDAAMYGCCIWFATEQGVVKYNTVHNSFETWTQANGLPTNLITSISIDVNGIIWAGTIDSGVCSYNGTKWITYPVAESKPYNYIIDIAIGPDEKVWISTQYWINSFDGITMDRFYLNNDESNKGITSITVDNINVVWIGTEKRGVFRFDGNEWKIFNNEKDTHPLFVGAIASGPDGKIWVGTLNDDGVYRYDGQSWIKTRVSPQYEDDKQIIKSITIDSNGMAWAVGPMGIYHGHEYSYYWSKYPVEGLVVPSYTIYDGTYRMFGIVGNVVISESNEVWGIYSNGIICRLEEKKWIHKATLNNFGSFSVGPIKLNNNGDLWFGTDDLGLYRYDSINWTNYTIKDGLSSHKINTIDIDPQGRVLAGSPNGINVIDGSECIHIMEGINIRLISCSNNGKIWASTSQGIFKIHSFSAWDSVSTENNFDAAYVHGIEADDDGSLWVVSDKYTLFRYFNGAWKIVSTKNGLPSDSVRYIKIDSKGLLWVTTNHPTILLSRQENNTWTHFSNEDGIEARVLRISEDNYGTIWINNGYVQPFKNGSWSFDEDTLVGGVTGFAIGDNGAIWAGKLELVDYMFYTYRKIGLFSFDGYEITSVENKGYLPSSLSLTSNYPNPFNSTTTITFSVPKTGFANLVIYNLMGQKVRNLVSEIISEGIHTIIWDGRDTDGVPVSSGIYLAGLTQGKLRTIRKMVLIR